jgi:hypothetical protein
MRGSRLMLSGGAVAALVVSGAIVSAQQPASKPAASKAETTRAVADIKGSGITGRAELVERKQGTGTVVDITDFAAAGGHFDPGPASNTDPDANHPFHMGDVPNLEAGQDGKGTLKAVTSRVTLSAGPLSIFDTDGTAIIIHGNPDQGITGAPKSGVSGGPRVACGVFSK